MNVNGGNCRGPLKGKEPVGIGMASDGTAPDASSGGPQLQSFNNARGVQSDHQVVPPPPLGPPSRISCQPPPPPPLVPLQQLLQMHVPPRLPHEHPVYKDGQYGQQDHGVGQFHHHRTSECKHPTVNWNGDLWWYPHNEGVQLHSQNKIDMQDHAKCQALGQILFDEVDGNCYPHDLDDALVNCSMSMQWYQMNCYRSRHKGYQAQCKHCGATTWAAWSTECTRGWRDQQRANIVHFIGLRVPPALMRPLEPTLPMV